MASHMTPFRTRKGWSGTSDFAEGIVGRLNPRTGEIKEWNNPFEKPGFPGGYQDLELDPSGNLWLGRHELNGFAKFDKKTEKFLNFSLPADQVSPSTREPLF